MIYTHVARSPAPKCESPLDLLEFSSEIKNKTVSNNPPNLIQIPEDTKINLELADTSEDTGQQWSKAEKQ